MNESFQQKIAVLCSFLFILSLLLTLCVLTLQEMHKKCLGSESIQRNKPHIVLCISLQPIFGKETAVGLRLGLVHKLAWIAFTVNGGMDPLRKIHFFVILPTLNGVLLCKAILGRFFFRTTFGIRWNEKRWFTLFLNKKFDFSLLSINDYIKEGSKPQPSVLNFSIYLMYCKLFVGPFIRTEGPPHRCGVDFIFYELKTFSWWLSKVKLD